MTYILSFGIIFLITENTEKQEINPGTEGFNPSRCIETTVREYEPEIYLITKGIAQGDTILYPSEIVDVKGLVLPRNTLLSIRVSLNAWKVAADIGIGKPFIEEEKQKAQKKMADVGTELVGLATPYGLTSDTTIKALRKLGEITTPERSPRLQRTTTQPEWAIYTIKDQRDLAPTAMLAVLDTSADPEKVTLVNLTRLLEVEPEKVGTQFALFQYARNVAELTDQIEDTLAAHAFDPSVVYPPLLHVLESLSNAERTIVSRDIRIFLGLLGRRFFDRINCLKQDASGSMLPSGKYASVNNLLHHMSICAGLDESVREDFMSLSQCFARITGDAEAGWYPTSTYQSAIFQDPHRFSLFYKESTIARNNKAITHYEEVIAFFTRAYSLSSHEDIIEAMKENLPGALAQYKRFNNWLGEYALKGITIENLIERVAQRANITSPSKSIDEAFAKELYLQFSPAFILMTKENDFLQFDNETHKATFNKYLINETGNQELELLQECIRLLIRKKIPSSSDELPELTIKYQKKIQQEKDGIAFVTKQQEHMKRFLQETQIPEQAIEYAVQLTEGMSLDQEYNIHLYRILFQCIYLIKKGHFDFSKPVFKRLLSEAFPEIPVASFQRLQELTR